MIISQSFRFMIIHYLKCICCSIQILISLLTIRMCFSLSVMMFSATFNNILVILRRCFINGGNRSTLLYHIMLYRVCPTVSLSVVSSTPSLSGIRTHNFSGERYWLHRYERGIQCLIYLEEWITCPTVPYFRVRAYITGKLSSWWNRHLTIWQRYCFYVRRAASVIKLNYLNILVNNLWYNMYWYL